MSPLQCVRPINCEGFYSDLSYNESRHCLIQDIHKQIYFRFNLFILRVDVMSMPKIYVCSEVRKLYATRSLGHGRGNIFSDRKWQRQLMAPGIAFSDCSVNTVHNVVCVLLQLYSHLNMTLARSRPIDSEQHSIAYCIMRKRSTTFWSFSLMFLYYTQLFSWVRM